MAEKKLLVNRLKHRITILRPPGPEDVDDYGQPIEDYVPIMILWAAIEPLRGREYFSAMREHAEVTTRIRIRYREGIDRTMRVVYNGTVFEILHIIHPEYNHHELQLMCKERQ